MEWWQHQAHFPVGLHQYWDGSVSQNSVWVTPWIKNLNWTRSTSCTNNCHLHQQTQDHNPSTSIANKHNLNAYDINHVNWKGIKSVMTKQKMNQHAVTTKFIYGWLPSQVFLHKQHRAPSLDCPICTNHFLPETTDHIIKCPHPLEIKVCTNLLNKCLKNLVNIAHTSPINIACWDECLHCELDFPVNNNPRKCQQPYWIVSAVHAMQCHQNILGWDKFLWGIISSKWISVQHLHMKAFSPKDPKCWQGWEFTSTEQILQIGLQIWKWQNDFTHGKTLKESKEKTHSTTLCKVQEVDPPSLLKWFPAVKQLLLSTWLQQNTCQLQGWLQIIDQQSLLLPNLNLKEKPSKLSPIQRAVPYHHL